MLPDMSYEGDLKEAVGVAFDVVLRLLDAAERRQSFPREGGSASNIDVDNERAKLQAIQMERRRYQELRARVHAGDVHGEPVLTELLESALGIYPAELEDDDAAYASYLQDLEEQGDGRRPSPA